MTTGHGLRASAYGYGRFMVLRGWNDARGERGTLKRSNELRSL